MHSVTTWKLVTMDGERRARVRQLAQEERWDEAKALLEQIPPDQRDVEWVALAAEVEAGLGATERALALYQRVLDERPRHPAALYNRALVFADAERYEEAVADLEDLFEVEGESEDTLALLAECYLGAQFFVPAWLCAKRWESIAHDASSRWSARVLEVRALDAMGRRQDARAVADEALAAWREPCPERDELLSLRAALDPRTQHGD
jgi:tetratricopeptide (TPR) repeat protein